MFDAAGPLKEYDEEIIKVGRKHQALAHAIQKEFYTRLDNTLRLIDPQYWEKVQLCTHQNGEYSFWWGGVEFWRMRPAWVVA